MAADAQRLDDHVEVRPRGRGHDRLWHILLVEEGQQLADARQQFELFARRRAKELLLALGKLAQQAGVDLRVEAADDRLVAQSEGAGEVAGRVRQRGLAGELVPGGKVVRAAIDDDAVQIEEDGDVTPHAT